MLLLCYRWEQYNKMLSDSAEQSKLNVCQLGVFTNNPTPFEPNDSIVTQLLKTPVPLGNSISTSVPHFDQSSKICSDTAFQILASGPEHTSSKFAAKLEKMIRDAKKNIVINHMYFQPTPKIMNALIGAAERGVEIKIITAGVYKDCPSSHEIFGPRNKYNCHYLVNSVTKEKRNNISIYEFQQKKKGNHKKVIVIDNNVIAGSSNLGYKSLVTTSDHELNFFAKSKKFAKETLEVCEVDINHSKLIPNTTTLTAKEYFKAALHRISAPLIG
jgi:phosphatidylserine/phosphatidylglycerophosphate/cardiolipin synthase-like enzyme